MKTIRKHLDADCLLDGELHPNIAERLERVRELPVRGVANLHGVEIDTEGVWLVWQYIPGQTLEEFLSIPREAGQLGRIAAQLQRTLGALHAHGIVHGAVHARNIIIDPTGEIHLTHISPLLFSDPSQDTEAMQQILARLHQPPPDPAHPQDAEESSDRRTRQTAYALFAAALAATLLIFAGILWYIHV